MRGEHAVGEGNLTWVKGDREPESLDDTSRKNLATGRHSADTRSNIQGSSPLPPRAGAGAGPPHKATGTSIFDPVLTELAYRWFCPPGGQVLDPFAGGSVRGIVASVLGYGYTGIDLRPEQVAANREQATLIVPDKPPEWIVGDARELASHTADPCDLVFSCPPYFDLEQYSDDPLDLSNMENYPAFLAAYRGIIAQAVALLRQDRFACVCVGDIRDRKGFYRNFVADTIAVFQDAGAMLYNEAILVTAAGSLPIRIGRQFGGYRKLGKTHQNVLVFYKGDPQRIPDVLGIVDVTDALALVVPLDEQPGVAAL
mgnify:CR=1 FL=1